MIRIRQKEKVEPESIWKNSNGEGSYLMMKQGGK